MQTEKVADDFINTIANVGPRQHTLTRWIVTLDDGIIAYQDDSGLGEFKPGSNMSSWERLQNYCKNNNNYIVAMKLQFRSHTEYLPSNAEGYFFRRSILGGLGLRDGKQAPDVFYFLAGVLKDGKVVVERWRTPELILETELKDIRDPSNYENCGKSLIRKDYVTVQKLHFKN